MFKIQIAGITAELVDRYPLVGYQCRDYLIDTHEPADIRAVASEDELNEELALGMSAVDRGSAESICLYRKIAAQLYRFDAFLMHGAVIGYRAKAYAFLAPSGTGKSTHIRLWHQYLGDKIIPVNGDKPILRLENGVFMAYGTPWAGKEGWQRNIGLPLAGVCLLKRGTENKIGLVKSDEAIANILRQIYLPPMPEGTLATMALADRLLTHIPIYSLACNMTEDAVKTAFEAMTGEEYR